MTVRRRNAECGVACLDAWEESCKTDVLRDSDDPFPYGMSRGIGNGCLDDCEVGGGNPPRVSLRSRFDDGFELLDHGCVAGEERMHYGLQIEEGFQVESCQRMGLQKRDAVKWDFLFSRRCLRVLLVEDDNTTRLVVRVLLQKCNYGVTTATNGLEAWNVMESASHPFDLVLTDVAMPILSGIDLLDKIMKSEVHRNTPVIMMSSCDSVDIVLKCLRSGAKDFLIKPLRKNELKHLWQHAWRKFHKERLNDNMETDQLVLLDNLKAEECGKQGCNEIFTKSQDSSLESGSKGLDLLGAIAYQSRQRRNEWEKAIDEKQPIGIAGRTKQRTLKKFSSQISHTSLLELGLQMSYLAQENTFKGDVKGGFRQSSNSAFSRYNSTVYQQQQNSTNCQSLSNEHFPCGGLNIQSTCTGEWTGTSINGSTASAMSYDRTFLDRLCVSSTHVSHPSVFDHSGFVVNSFSPIRASGGDKGGKDMVQDETFLGLVSSTPDGHISTVFSPQHVQTNDGEHRGRFGVQAHLQYLSVPVASPCQDRQHCTTDMEVCSGCVHDCNQHLQNNCHNDRCQVKSSIAAAGSLNQDQESISESRIETPFCASDNEILQSEQDSDVGNSILTGNAICSLMDTVSGDKQGSNEDSSVHRSSTSGRVLTDEPLSSGSSDSWANTEDRIVMGKQDGSISVDGDVKDSVLASDQVRNTLREAALYKFRQKRKLRCFEKKVHYQSRKRLAEQRPRIKGQFVRQAMNDETSDQEWNTGTEGLDLTSHT
eukprot:c27249_g1_i1 orf=88-2379(+)